MTTTQRERYRQALATLEQVQQQVTRQEMLYQLLVTRLREADVEGFEEEASQLEGRADELAGHLAAEQEQVVGLTAQARELKVLATVEEIDEVMVDYDAALLAILGDVERLTTAIEAAAAVAGRAVALAADLPPAVVTTHRTVEMAAAQAGALSALAARLTATLTRVDLPPAAPPPAGAPPAR